jgi:hypothetical protein
MAGGAGGAGGSPNGVAGATGPTTTAYLVAGGAGGQNSRVVIDGANLFGPYGRGGYGADSNTRDANDGNPGAVVIIWGGGVSGTARSA